MERAELHSTPLGSGPRPSQPTAQLQRCTGRVAAAATKTRWGRWLRCGGRRRWRRRRVRSARGPRAALAAHPAPAAGATSVAGRRLRRAQRRSGRARRSRPLTSAAPAERQPVAASPTASSSRRPAPGSSCPLAGAGAERRGGSGERSAKVRRAAAAADLDRPELNRWGPAPVAGELRHEEVSPRRFSSSTPAARQVAASSAHLRPASIWAPFPVSSSSKRLAFGEFHRSFGAANNKWWPGPLRPPVAICARSSASLPVNRSAGRQ